jgi:hypothetical protein
MCKLVYWEQLGTDGKKRVYEVITARERGEQRNGPGVILGCFETLFVRKGQRHGPRVNFAFSWQINLSELIRATPRRQNVLPLARPHRSDVSRQNYTAKHDGK